MFFIMELIHGLFPLISLFLLLAGIKTRHKNFILIALWLSLIAIILRYQTADNEILGTYFNYLHALIYSISIIVLLGCLNYLILDFAKKATIVIIPYLASLVAACSTIGGVILLANLWINAQFIENKMDGTPILQVATFKKVNFCPFRYVFYKVTPQGGISYMCPNYYGLLPKVGTLKNVPDYVIRQLPPELQIKLHLSPAKNL